MGLMSKRKGRLGEQEVCTILRQLLGDVAAFERNSMQAHNNGMSKKDILTNLPLAIEVKRTEAKTYRQFLDQARNQAVDPELPVLFHRSNGEPWKVVMELSPTEFAHLIRAWLHFMKSGKPGLKGLDYNKVLAAIESEESNAAE
jgi:hypothetical protein